MKKIIGLLLLAIMLINPSCVQSDYLIFSYFTGNGEDGLHLTASRDGIIWNAINDGHSLLTPEVGNDKLMRDPCIVKGSDNIFHMVWTTGWYNDGIGYAYSKDLIHWSEQKYLPVMGHEPNAKNCWAPEITYDTENKNYVIYWSTTIKGKFSSTDSSSEDDNNHRIYYTTTSDFQNFSETRLLYDKGFNVIDASIYFDNNQYIMLLKDETLEPAQKNIRISFSDHLTGPYSEPTEPITGDYWAEGPTAIKIDGSWMVYFDMYKEGQFGAIKSDDLEEWEDISGSLSFPSDIRHGTALRVSKDIYEALQSLSVN